MTPPKITRPAIPAVEHTFPAWYRSRHAGQIALFDSESRGVYWDEKMELFMDLEITDEDRQCWERLPSGTVIEFTQP